MTDSPFLVPLEDRKLFREITRVKSQFAGVTASPIQPDPVAAQR